MAGGVDGTALGVTLAVGAVLGVELTVGAVPAVGAGLLGVDAAGGAASWLMVGASAACLQPERADMHTPMIKNRQRLLIPLAP